MQKKFKEEIQAEISIKSMKNLKYIIQNRIQIQKEVISDLKRENSLYQKIYVVSLCKRENCFFYQKRYVVGLCDCSL